MGRLRPISFIAAASRARKASGVSGLAAASRRAIMAFAEAAESCWAAMMWIKPEKPRGRRRRGGNP